MTILPLARRTTALTDVVADLAPSRNLPVRVDGRHLRCGEETFRVRGVTYGSFVPRGDGELYPERDVLAQDLKDIANTGLNTVRTYTLPPAEFLDMASAVGLHVIVGLHYDDWRAEVGTGRRVHQRILDSGRRAVDAALERVAGRPEVLALSVGNEVPAALVRLHGITPIERTLGRLVEHIHAAQADLLATYNNFPTTEYLQIPGLDLACFNVFLEHQEPFRAYLRHLQVVAGEIPLLLTELGLASELHGERAQADSVDWQLQVVDESGCAGATVFAWTDEWGIAGQSVEGWGFGLTRADRSPKPAIDVVSGWARRSIHEVRESWPRLTVVVCAYNEERLLRECLDSLAALDYPDLDIVLCDDGSTDSTLQIMRSYPFRVLALPHRGLSAARNAGLAAAFGDMIAYLDADARCHPEWPYHLALSMEEEGVVATGGPNLPFADAPFVEQAVAASPGSPVEVLVSDDRAEHVPGCNMAYRREALAAIGGFDIAYTCAGDDVDVCWRLLDRGDQIAFAPAAQVHHHRRSTVAAYLRQQRGYGRSEKLVASRHPHRFNQLGQARWTGVIYGGLRILPTVLRPVIYHGSLGSAPYQPLQRRRAELLFGWYAALLPLTAPLALCGLALAFVEPDAILLTAVALGAVALYGSIVVAAATPPKDQPKKVTWRALVAFLHLAQPFVRTWGRVLGKRPPPRGPTRPVPWTGDRIDWIMAFGRELSIRRCRVTFTSPDARHDLTASVGPFVRAKVTTAVLWSWTPVIRVRLRPRRAGVAALAAVIACSWSIEWETIAAMGATMVILGLAETHVLRQRLAVAFARTTTGSAQ